MSGRIVRLSEKSVAYGGQLLASLLVVATSVHDKQLVAIGIIEISPSGHAPSR